mmetsp:Transcript_19019/g.56751  ORF Transcript_19019/g.56751 Transcript_19019/m.56751 type:complete len:430 (+) Transcript_19019:73-1362(+)
MGCGGSKAGGSGERADANSEFARKYNLDDKELGTGAFSRVILATSNEGTKVAVKCISKNGELKQEDIDSLHEEVAVLRSVDHPNIVKLYDFFDEKRYYYMAIELMEGGELFERIVKKTFYNEMDARGLVRILLDALAYLHHRGIVHRDLKPENLLLDSEGTLKISDFGLSALYDGEEGSTRSQMLHTTCGTPNYVAPEVLQNEGYVGRIADCWSIGVILYVLLAGFLPFDEATMSALFDKIKRAEFAYPAHFSDGVKVLIDSLLVADPQKRATLTDVQKDRWFLDQSLSTVATDQVVQPLMRKKSSLKTSKSTRVQSLTSSSSPTQVVEALRKALVASGATLAEDAPPKPEETEDETDDEGPGTRSVEASLQSPSGLLALVATARPADNGAALDLLRGKGDILAFQAWLQGVLEAVRAAGVTLTGPPEP